MQLLYKISLSKGEFLVISYIDKRNKAELFLYK